SSQCRAAWSIFFFSSRRRHTRCYRDWSSDVCSSDLVSPKPQSTRLPVVGLLTRDDAQFIFTDSPGLLEPEYKLHETMRAAALRAIADAEVIAYLHPLPEFPAPPLTEVAKLDRAPRAPIVTVYTKADLAPTSSNLPQPPPSSTTVVS